MVYTCVSRSIILCFSICYVNSDSYRFVFKFVFLMFIQHLTKEYYFELWCINNFFNTCVFVNSCRTTTNGDCLYNSYKDGDRCRGMLYFNERFQWYILCKKLLYMQRHFTHVLLHFLVKFKFIILCPFKRWPSRIFKKRLHCYSF